MKIISKLIIILFIAILGLVFITRDFSQTADTLYINGNIITINKHQETAQVMLVENGLIKAIGSNSELENEHSMRVKVVDLNGATVLPGFIDSHTHVALSGFLENMVDLSGFTHKSNKEVWNHLRMQISGSKKGEWIVCKGLDPILVTDLVTPDIQFLNEIAPNNPLVILSQSLHTYWANSAALSKAGITRETQDPSASSYYEKDEHGNLTGLIAEQAAFIPILEDLKKTSLSSKVLIDSTTTVLKNYAKNGNTTVVSTGLSINDAKPLRMFEHLSSNKTGLVNHLLSRFGVLPERSANPRHFIYMRHDRANLLPDKIKPRNDFYDIIGIKHWFDGSPYTGSMYLSEPYLVSDLTRNGLHIPQGGKGKALLSHSELLEFIREYHHKGWQIAVHAQGDSANTEVLKAFSEINSEIDISKARHRVEHSLLITEENLEQLAVLNMTPNFHINHLYYYGQALRNDIIGVERANKILQIGTAEKLGLRYSMHADAPMFESQPFRLIQTAIERQTKEGDVLGLEQAIDIHSALKAMTINAAYQINMDTKLGSLEVGKYADFIILDQDPLKVAVSDLDKIKVVNTFVNGNQIN